MRKPVETLPQTVPEDESDPDDTSGLRDAIDKALRPVVRGRRGAAVQRVVSVMHEYYQGPVPHPQHLREFEEICPGTAERLVRMAEKQQDANIEITRNSQNAENRDRTLGMVFGFLSFCGLIVGGIICAADGQPWLGGLFLAASTVGIVAKFVNGRKS